MWVPHGLDSANRIRNIRSPARVEEKHHEHQHFLLASLPIVSKGIMNSVHLNFRCRGINAMKDLNY